MMKRMILAMILVLVWVTLSGIALAAPPHLKGVPKEFRPGDARGIFIWQDKDGMHVRSTTAGRGHVFSGVIRTNGEFYNVRGVREEAGDFYRVSRGRDDIAFRFRTAKDVDGLDFRVKEGSRLYFDLFMDGHRIDTREIYVGRHGWHPEHSAFTIYK